MLNILLVEDNIELRQLMKIHLQRARYNIFEADDGLAALDLMQHQHIHLLIVDIMMPRMNGFVFLCNDPLHWKNVFLTAQTSKVPLSY